MRFYPVRAEELGDWWEKAVPLLERVLERGEVLEDLGMVYDALIARQMQMWVETDEALNATGVVVTQQLCIGGRHLVQVRYAAGSWWQGWRQWLAAIEAWAKTAGCDAVEVVGRKGWEKLLAEDGYGFAYQVVRKVL